MNYIVVTPKQSLNKAYQKEKVIRKDIESFKIKLSEFLNNINEQESEEHAKNLVTKFLYDTYYNGKNQINTKGRIDLAIYEDKKPVVILEAKRPSSPDMVSVKDINKKAIHELILYYLQERVDHGNIDIKYLIVTDIYEWFIFDSSVFDTLFYRNSSFMKEFNEWKNGQKARTDRDLFYNDIAKPFLSKLQDKIEFIWFDLREVQKVVKDADTKNDNKLINLYKILSPAHLLKQPFANDSNSLDTKFYSELLHIIGLEEKKDGGKKLIQRKEKPDQGSLLENAINILVAEERLYKLPNNASAFGETEKERLFNVGLELCITWINRILFLKLLEGQLLTYHSGDDHYKFLNFKTIPNFDELNKLFFQVLARKPEERTNAVREKFERVPYLNSSLFDISSLEADTIRINSLDDGLRLELHKSTVLKTDNGKKREGELPTLQYLFEFLDAYDFSSEGKEEIQEENKALINASVLGLIFEKINGYKDGSFFTPGFITMYMCRETIRRALVQKFNEAKGWKLESFDQLHNEIKDSKEANAIINSLKICDPAVGSGHFLVSALNEVIAIKSELHVLMDRHGKLLRDYAVEVVNDELIVSTGDHEFFEYKPGNKESQRVQEALFHEKQTIIENCLFGVDINPNSVKICRLRLWIELLKNAYYTEKSKFKELETLPNIDINIKQGNSLISRFPLDADLSKALNSIKYSIDDYRGFVNDYKNATDKDAKRGFEKLIEQIKKDFRTEISKNDPKVQQLNKKSGELYNILNQVYAFELSDKEKKERDKKKEKLEAEINKLSAEIEEIKNSAIYKDAFEWRFEFPEVLDHSGTFVGFDAVIGNPPYIRHEEIKDFKEYLKLFYRVYSSTADILIYFFELGIRLIQKGGKLSLIVSNKFMKADYGIILRKFLSEIQLNDIIDFGELPVFDSASTFPAIINITNNSPKSTYYFAQITDLEFTDLKQRIETVASELDGSILQKPTWFLSNRKTVDLLEKLKLQGVSLKDYLGSNKIKYGIKTGFNEAFFIDKQTKQELESSDERSHELIKNLAVGDDIRKLKINYSDKYLLLIKIGTHLHNYPAIVKHLTKYKNRLEERSDKGPNWWELRACDYYGDFKAPKIVYPIIAKESRFAYSEEEIYFNDKTFFIPIKDHYLLGYLNSKIAWFYLKNICSVLGDPDKGGRLELRTIYMETLPIPKMSIEQRNLIAQNVELILKANGNHSNLARLEHENDSIFYEVFRLTNEEIKIVEGN